MVVDHPQGFGSIESRERIGVRAKDSFEARNGRGKIELAAIGRVQAPEGTDRHATDPGFFVVEGFDEPLDGVLAEILNLAQWVLFKIGVFQTIRKLPQQLDHVVVFHDIFPVMDAFSYPIESMLHQAAAVGKRNFRSPHFKSGIIWSGRK